MLWGWEICRDLVKVYFQAVHLSLPVSHDLGEVLVMMEDFVLSGLRALKGFTLNEKERVGGWIG